METVFLVIKCLKGYILKLFILMQNKIPSTEDLVDSIHSSIILIQDKEVCVLCSLFSLETGVSVSSKGICIPWWCTFTCSREGCCCPTSQAFTHLFLISQMDRLVIKLLKQHLFLWTLGGDTFTNSFGGLVRCILLSCFLHPFWRRFKASQKYLFQP